MRLTSIQIGLFLYAFLMGTVQAADAPVLGRTYAIIEEDALTEIERRAEQVDGRSLINPDRRSWKAMKSVSLPASQDRQRYALDLTYTTTLDVPGERGTIMYPSGYRFNPLEYVQVPYTIGIFGAGPVQLAWAKKHHVPGMMWLTAGGDPIEAGEVLETPVYLYTPEMAERFNVRAVPVLLKQEGNTMWAEQYVADEDDLEEQTNAKK